MCNQSMPITIISPKTHKIVWIASAIVLAVHVFAGCAMGYGGDTGITFEFSDRIAIVGVGLVLVLGILLGLRPKITIEPSQLIVRNLANDIRIPWNEIVRFDFEKYWAYAVVGHEERIILLAIPIIDGSVAVEHMRLLRYYWEQYHNSSPRIPTSET